MFNVCNDNRLIGMRNVESTDIHCKRQLDRTLLFEYITWIYHIFVAIYGDFDNQLCEHMKLLACDVSQNNGLNLVY